MGRLGHCISRDIYCFISSKVFLSIGIVQVVQKEDITYGTMSRPFAK